MHRHFNLPHHQWSFAYYKLHAAPNGTKLLHSLRYQTTHSFIKIGGRIYALAPGKEADAVIGEGSFAKVKFAEDEDHVIWAIKIYTRHKWSLAEELVAEDLSLDVAFAQNPENGKFYSVMPYLGETLRNRIKRQPLTFEEQHEFGKQLCWRVFQLHHGHSSAQGIAYAHSDLKQANITIDENEKVHMVDFGFTRYNPKGLKLRRSGTDKYLPPADADGFIRISREACDVLALKRILCMLRQYHCFSGYHEVDEEVSVKGLLSPEFIKRYQLEQFLDTGSASEETPYDFKADKTSAVELCAMFVSIETGLSFGNKQQALALAGMHMAGMSREVISATLHVPMQRNLTAALVDLNLLAKLDAYLQNTQFMQILSDIVLPHKTICALVLINEMRLNDKFNMSNLSLVTAKAILALFRSPNRSGISLLARDNDLAHIICALERNGLEEYYELALLVKELRPALTMLADRPNEKAFIALSSIKHRVGVSATEYSIQELIKIIEDENTASAFYSLFRFHLTRQYAKPVLQSPEKAKMVAQCKRLGAFATEETDDDLAGYFEDEEFRQAIDSAPDDATAFAIIGLNKCGMRSSFQRVLDSTVSAWAIYTLTRHTLNEFFQSALTNEHFATVVCRFTMSTQITALDFSIFLSRMERAKSLAAIYNLFSRNVLNDAEIMQLARNYKLLDITVYMFHAGFSDSISSVLRSFRKFLLYQDMLNLLVKSHDFIGATKIAMWELDDITEEVVEGSNLPLRMTACADNKEQSQLFFRFYRLLDAFEDRVSAQVKDSHDMKLSEARKTLFQLTVTFFTPENIATARARFQLFRSAFVAELEKCKPFLNANEESAFITALEDIAVCFQAIEAEERLVDPASNLFRPAPASSSDPSTPEPLRRHLKSTSSTKD